MTLPAEEPTYYEQWGPVWRRVRFAFDAISFAWTKVPVVLFESKWRLGDEIMLIPVYEAMAKRLGKTSDEYRFVVWCNYPELLEGNPYVDAVNEPIKRPQLYLNLRGAPRDVSRPEYYQTKLNLESMGVPRLYGEYAAEVGAENVTTVALCPGASWETKRWLLENWKVLGRALESEGYKVIVLGQEGEEIDVGTSFVGRTGVWDVACLLGKADLTISNDSGLMHLSLAAGTRTMGLFGPTASEILIEGNPDFYPLGNGRECQGCWNRDLSIEEPGSCPKNIEVCMETISVEDVLAKVVSILSVVEE